MLQIMKRDRFTLILRFLHLNDSTQYRKKGEPGHNALFKLRPFIEPLFSNFQSHYTLSKEVCIDESMISFKGRLSFIQYVPKKPTKWGMKAFVLADSKTGYLYNWHLYTEVSFTYTYNVCIEGGIGSVCTLHTYAGIHACTCITCTTCMYIYHNHILYSPYTHARTHTHTRTHAHTL